MPLGVTARILNQDPGLKRECRMNSLREAYTNQKRSFSHVKNKEKGGGVGVAGKLLLLWCWHIYYCSITWFSRAGITLKDLPASHDDRPSRRENISLLPFTNYV